MSDTNKKKIEHKSIFKENISWLFAAISFTFALIYFVNYMIDKKISNSEFINEVASRVRPALIFDANGSILADMGARKLINKIEIHKDTIFPSN